MDWIWLKIIVLVLIGYFVYKEILKSAANGSAAHHQRSKAGFAQIVLVGSVVAGFTYIGMSVTWIETKDLRPYRIEGSPQMVSVFDPGVIELNGMVIKTNLAPRGELSALAASLVEGCGGARECEAQKLFDYVTAIPYRTDHTSRDAREVIATRWGDCDDKSNLYASLLNEREIDYLLVYVPQHVFMAVHLDSAANLPLLRASLQIDGKRYYYAETTATNASLGEFNGQFPASFQGVYDLERNEAVNTGGISFRLF